MKPLLDGVDLGHGSPLAAAAKPLLCLRALPSLLLSGVAAIGSNVAARGLLPYADDIVCRGSYGEQGDGLDVQLNLLQGLRIVGNSGYELRGVRDGLLGSACSQQRYKP